MLDENFWPVSGVRISPFMGPRNVRHRLLNETVCDANWCEGAFFFPFKFKIELFRPRVSLYLFYAQVSKFADTFFLFIYGLFKEIKNNWKLCIFLPSAII